MTETLEKGASALRTTIAAGVGWAAGRHVIGDDTASLLVTVAPIIIPYVWGWVSHGSGAIVKAVERMQGVKLEVDTQVAPEAAVAAALDTTRPKVVVAKES